MEITVRFFTNITDDELYCSSPPSTCAHCTAKKLSQSFCFLFSPRTTSGSQSDSRWNPARPGVTGGNQSPACKLQLWDPQDDMASETSKVKERWVPFSPFTIDSFSSISVVAVGRNAWFQMIGEKLLTVLFRQRTSRKKWRCNTAGFI